MKKTKVLVAMSGGVDSSVAAALLVEAGYEVIGVTMQLWDYSKNEESCNPNDKFDTCCSLDDVADARMVAHKLNIPFYVFDYQDDFKENVVDYFIDEYLKGKTPNPCVACNTFLKFDHLLDRAQRLGCDYIATGHYARIKRHEIYPEFSLIKGLDHQKDQSYFLYSLNQKRLAKTLFPVGDMTKAEVRLVAEKYGLLNAKKKESMEICFIPNNDYAKFISAQANPSDIITGFIYHENGDLLGPHTGIHQFTVGQRKGLGIATGLAVYVTRIDAQSGDVFVGGEEFLMRTSFTIHNFHLVRNIYENGANTVEEKNKFLSLKEFDIKIRYRSKPCRAVLQHDGEKMRVQFLEKQKAVTPGQIAVIYAGDEVLGGGFIDESF